MGFAPENQVCTGLPAGGRWIRTLGPPATASFVVRPLPLVAAKGRWRRSRHCGSARFLLLGKPFHRAGGVHGFGGLRFVALLGGFCVPAVQLIYTCALHR